MRPKIPQWMQALTGNFGDHHEFLCRLHLQRIDQAHRPIGELPARIEHQIGPLPAGVSTWRPSRGGRVRCRGHRRRDRRGHQPLKQQPGTWRPGPSTPRTSRVRRQTALRQDPPRQPVAGRCAGHRGDCRGRHQRHRLPRGLLPALGTPGRGKTKAIVVVGYSILVAVRQMRTNDVDYADLGGVYFARLHPERAMHRIVRQANASAGMAVRADAHPSTKSIVAQTYFASARTMGNSWGFPARPRRDLAGRPGAVAVARTVQPTIPPSSATT